ncbi:MAG: hypothetical protein HYZ08_00910 [Candidatus Kerfeldbacteria bacterium]|nr:hypothetical protein [Candidatus Kerfeldbacteria bacterium]
MAIWAALLLLVPVPSLGQGLKTGSVHWTGEFEFTRTNDAGQTNELYIFGDQPKVNLLFEGLFVEDGLHRGEFGIGKTILVHKLIIKPYAGLTTDGAVFTPVVAIWNLWGRTAVYIADPKFYQSDKPNTLYQKASFALTKSVAWQVRWERFQVFGVPTVFNRLGVERRLWVRSNTIGVNSHIHVAGFVDTTNKQPGLAVGFRWQ